MIRIRSERVLDENYQTLVIKYPDDLRFAEELLIEQYRKNEVEKWGNTFHQKVTIDLDYIEIPKKVNVKNICRLTAEEMSITMDALFGKTKNREVVEARMFAVNICLDNFVSPALIEAETPFKNRIYYYYQNQLNNLRETDSKTDMRYKEVFDNVMGKL